jgi:hypothetical protein
LLGEAVSDTLVQAINDKRAQAFVFDKPPIEVFELWLERQSHEQYGVIVAQRRGRAIWLVVAGLSGPGTFACAEILSTQNCPANDSAGWLNILFASGLR